MTVENSDNVPLAIALVLGAGASTGLGAAVVFFPSLVMIASRKVLGGSLGFSAGVMIYVSFVEIMGKSVIAFKDGGYDANKAQMFAAGGFFGGVIIMMILNKIVSSLLGDVNTRGQPGPVSPTPVAKTMRESDSKDDDDEEQPAVEKVEIDGVEIEVDDDFEDNLPLPNQGNNDDDDADSKGEGEMDEDERKKLVAMGMNTALAIGLHNFPEGLATFVAAVNDPAIGLVLAVAIAIHNIPEGLCVALPIYYATGSRLKAFLWALSSGASEVVAALLGWAVLASAVDDVTYGILFAVVAGMMVIISVRELLPTAHHYDPEDRVVSHAFILGMMLIAISLVLFLV
ncbi:unnamed protein product [Cylindrotheca closterium]|uniref:Zinc transporter ZupT n=1 Tax=Cylindrotheca closterium TaxID=2856 RepID=A0AAD2G138_9STRA|nr:unnamed protein product [Cylindrotheca closterium]